MLRKTRAALSDRTLTYDRPGLTTTGWDRSDPPAGFRTSERTTCLGTGASRWRFASTEVLRWGIKTRSGFTVEDDELSVSRAVVAGSRYWLIAELGPVRIREPVEVVVVIDEPNRKGFAYGTLTGHPVSGEEAFVVDRRADGSIWLTVRSSSRSARGRWRVMFPLLRLAQRFYTSRYLRALRFNEP